MKSFLTIRTVALPVVVLILSLSVRAYRPRSEGEPARFPMETPADAFDAAHAATLLVDAIIQVESNGDPRKVGRHGERGLMQIKAGTWRDMTTKLFGTPRSFDQAFDPVLNRRVGTAYLAFLQERLLPRQAEWQADERSLLLAAYNAGPGRLHRSGFDLARLPRQTRDYVERAGALHDVYLDDMAGPVHQRLFDVL